MQSVLHSPDSFLASFVSSAENGQLLLISGPRRSGKTRWCCELAQAAPACGLIPAGLISPPVYAEGERVAIELLDLTTRQARRLAVRREDGRPGLLTEFWSLDESVLEWGNQILSRLAGWPFLIVDEIGPLELLRGRGLTAALPLLSARDYRLACAVVRFELLEHARTRWPWARTLWLGPEAPA